MSITGDFIGFSLDGIRSEDLGIIRVSDGSRYNENLLPSFSDKTIQVPGSDRTLYFKNERVDKQISFDIVFDHLTESQFRYLNYLFGKKELQKLILDEFPYKYYLVKVSDSTQLKYLCFTEDDQRIYKGEGTINFIAYYPYARSTKLYLSNEEQDAEWAAASHLSNTYPVTYINNEFTIYCSGDLKSDLQLYIPFSSNYIPASNIAFNGINEVISWQDIIQTNEDATGIIIDSEKQYIRECIADADYNITLLNDMHNNALQKMNFPKLLSYYDTITHQNTLKCVLIDNINQIKFEYTYY